MEEPGLLHPDWHYADVRHLSLIGSLDLSFSPARWLGLSVAMDEEELAGIELDRA